MGGNHGTLLALSSGWSDVPFPPWSVCSCRGVLWLRVKMGTTSHGAGKGHPSPTLLLLQKNFVCSPRLHLQGLTVQTHTRLFLLPDEKLHQHGVPKGSPCPVAAAAARAVPLLQAASRE